MSTLTAERTVPSTGRTPGRVVGALCVLGAYLVVSVIGFAQLLSLREHLGRSGRAAVDTVLWVGVGLVVAFVVAAALLLRRVSRVPLLVLSAVSIGLALYGLRGSGLTLAALYNLGSLVAMLVLVSGPAVARWIDDARTARRAGRA
ncbi:hypothetical protein [Nakamurella endophytica]|uniref:Uncharacterized protein n=1 Tax=Nakamurella endophytica TaxID=1748367 RepID=A0A917W9I5_9ACTN|nr:hypothetical protein [Nakamurella endophytica]GGL85249.1 hypothetical protein GCM10011594_01140 [Nakamurella endophytica]